MTDLNETSERMRADKTCVAKHLDKDAAQIVVAAGIQAPHLMSTALMARWLQAFLGWFKTDQQVPPFDCNQTEILFMAVHAGHSLLHPCADFVLDKYII